MTEGGTARRHYREDFFPDEGNSRYLHEKSSPKEKLSRSWGDASERMVRLVHLCALVPGLQTSASDPFISGLLEAVAATGILAWRPWQ
jgi:hypothetical protein